MEDYDFLTCEIRSEVVDAIINRCDICRVGHTSVEDYGRLGGVVRYYSRLMYQLHNVGRIVSSTPPVSPSGTGMVLGYT